MYVLGIEVEVIVGEFVVVGDGDWFFFEFFWVDFGDDDVEEVVGFGCDLGELFFVG